jgi:hypothetical protein
MKRQLIPALLLPPLALFAASCPSLGQSDAPVSLRPAEELGAVLETVREAVGWSAFAKARGELRLTGDMLVQGEEGEFEFLFTSRGEFVRETRGKFAAAYGHDGTTAWSRDRGGLTREIVMEDRDLSLFEHWIITGYWLDPASPLELALLEGDELRIRVGAPHSPMQMVLKIDGETSLPSTLTYDSGAGDYVWTFRNWKTVEGLHIAHTLSATDSGGLSDTFEVRRAGPAPSFLRSPYGFHPSAAEDVKYDAEAQGILESKLLTSGHLLVKPLVNGKDVGWFIFDTGAGAMCIDPGVADELDLPAFGEETAVGMAGKTTTCFRESESLSLGSTTMVGPYFIEIDLAFLKPHFGVSVAGIIGYDYIARTVVELEPATGRISVFVPSEYELATGSWTPLQIDENHPVVHASFEGDREGPFKLDTGADGTVIFHAPAVERLELLKGREVRVGRAMGVGGAGKTYGGEIEWFELGGHRFQRPQVGFAQVEIGALRDAYTLGNIGHGFLTPFRLVFDYPQQRIAFVPRKELEKR